ncbi:MAG: hypothetical protein HC822_23805 [Oscillochloris sp.]|nr:hypothetical protein [Oscillochloris sp.]
MSNESHAGEQHPEEWRRDLNPDPQAGQNRGGAHLNADETQTAVTLHSVQPHLADLSEEELRRVPIVPPGSRLKQGAVYLNLRDAANHEFTATGDQEATPNDLLIPKSEVDYPLWNKLLRVMNPARRDEEG